MKCDVISLENKKVGSVDLDEAVFGTAVRADLMSRYVNWQLAKRRSGNHKVKTRSEVQGTTAKPFKQKGTGNARQGSKRAPQLRGGGVVFGPHVRDHGFGLQKKVRRLALKSALSSKQAEGKLVVLDNAKMKNPKTADLIKNLGKLGWGKALVIDGNELDNNFQLAARNVMGLNVLPSQGANVYDILRSDTLVLTKDAIDKLVERLK
ncbi:MAG: 50S ribosomal protein L4 [Rhodospirillaceae bacterium]|jgi:large subunit ribosomal protein L4|nr:50S ribosomal protein L4 [Rhodospirillaceae bacterium]MBT5563578.1 50S ribosomal protein L4 [Rhodospirillaceae bacterium]MBT6241410.1 50S ribosomal protein L4 [Rhodospirillaceae bacterium]MBT7136238.1 50S ribosomal protein L4 [Rhodospirillaceae bacterium]